MSKRVPDQILNKIQQGFNAVCAKATKVGISFNPIWAAPDNRITGVIMHPGQRLIMKHGEIYTTQDKFHRSIVLVGTHYGIVALYKKSIFGGREEWAIEVCPKLVEKGFFEADFNLIDTPLIFDQINDGTFFQAVCMEVQNDTDNGIPVTDGIPLPEKTKKAPSKKPVAKPKQTQQHKKRFDDRSKKPRPQQVESSQRTFNNGDHHHDPVTGIDYTFSEGKWKANKPVEVYVELKSEQVNEIVVKGLNTISGRGMTDVVFVVDESGFKHEPNHGEADNTTFSLAP